MAITFTRWKAVRNDDTLILSFENIGEHLHDHMESLASAIHCNGVRPALLH